MSYLHGVALQEAVHAALVGSTVLADLTQGAVFDAPPAGAVPETYVLIGDEWILDRSSKTSQAAIHDLKITVFSGADGFKTAKSIAAEICNVLGTGTITIAQGVLVDLKFRSARAARASGQDRRQIVLNFQNYIDTD